MVVEFRGTLLRAAILLRGARAYTLSGVHCAIGQRRKLIRFTFVDVLSHFYHLEEILTSLG